MLLNIPAIEIAKLWGELVESYYGVNGFAGNTCELYAYRFGRYSPIADKNPKSEFAKEHFIELGLAAVELLVLFKKTYECTITVDSLPLPKFKKQMKEIGFHHRIHVQISKHH